MEKKEKTLALQAIAEEIKNCPVCKEEKSGVAVPGEGNPDAGIMFIGEAPGKQEAKIGRPFIGRSGNFLRQQIRQIGLKEEDVYITSPVKYLPNRGTPTPAHIAHGKLHLEKQISVIQPKLFVLMGNTAMRALLENPPSITQNHGTLYEEKGRKYFLMFHPAAAIRFTKFRTAFTADFETLKKIL